MAALPVPLLFRCVLGGLGDFCIKKDVTVIGRSADCDIVLDHPVISAQHVTLRAVRDPAPVTAGAAATATDAPPRWQYLVTDHSKNGVWIDKTLIGTGNTVPLSLGDIVTLCRTASTRIKMQLIRGADGATWEPASGSGKGREKDAVAAGQVSKLSPDSLASSPLRVTGGSTESGVSARSVHCGGGNSAASGGSGSCNGDSQRSNTSSCRGSDAPPLVPAVPSLETVYAPPGSDPHLDYEFSEDDAHRLGSGAYSVVFKGTDKTTGQVVAIKRIAPQSPSSQLASTVNPLDEEVRILASLAHPNIVQLYRVYVPKEGGAGSTSSGYTYLVQELVAGGELFDKVVAKSRFPEAHARGLFRQMLLGVAYLHSRGVVHRDLKPENILLQPLKILSNDSGGGSRATTPQRGPSEEGAGAAAASATSGAAWKKRWQVKISDFGMSRMLLDRQEARAVAAGSTSTSSSGSSPHGSSRTPPALASRPTAIGRFNTVVGTEAYLAPELRVRFEQSSFDAVRAAVRADVRRRSRALPRVSDREALAQYLAAVDEDVEAMQSWLEEQQEREVLASQTAKRPRLESGGAGHPSSPSAASGPPPPTLRDLPQPPVLPEGMQRLPTAADYLALAEAAERGYDGAVDSWSLGVVLYICLLGEMPFFADQGRPPATVQHLTSFWRADHPAWQELSPLAKDLVDALLHPNPKLRLLPAAALHHPWLTGQGTTTTTSAAPQPQ